MFWPCRKPGVQVDLFEGEPATPRPAWRVIETARNRNITGELALPTDPPTNVYLLNGEVYFAERITDGGIGVRLLVEGVITRQQMNQGAVMVSGVEHLGRMFERDETIDRHAVELCVELMTDDVLTTIAQDVVNGATMTLYKRHPSGIDRWLPNHLPNDAEPGTEEPDPGRLGTAASPPSTPSASPPPPTPAPSPPQFTPAAAPTLPTLPPQHAEVPRAVEQVVHRPPVQAPTLDSPTQTPASTPYADGARVPARHPDATDEGSTIADEVADAVRRALAAIDSVLIPTDDNGNG